LSPVLLLPFPTFLGEKMTKEQWTEACGYFDDEHYLVSAIKTHLLIEDQRKWLFDQGLSIEDLLNGRWPENMEEDIALLYDDWNLKLGWKEFGI
jgi:hypothetical protein